MSDDERSTFTRRLSLETRDWICIVDSANRDGALAGVFDATAGVYRNCFHPSIGSFPGVDSTAFVYAFDGKRWTRLSCDLVDLWRLYRLHHCGWLHLDHGISQHGFLNKKEMGKVEKCCRLAFLLGMYQ